MQPSTTETIAPGTPAPQTGPASDTRALYEQRLADRAQRRRSLSRRDLLLANARLVLFLALLVMLWLAFLSSLFPPAWCILPAIAFIGLIVAHDRAIRARRRAERATAFYEAGLRRIDDTWAGSGPAGEAYLDRAHPYAEDLDIFGPASLFQLLCAARTSIGEHTLASWLLAPASSGEVRERQAAVADLRDRLDLREDLSVEGEEIAGTIHPEALERWASAPPSLVSPWVPIGAALTSAATTAGVLGWAAFGAGPLPFLAALAVQLAFGQVTRRPVVRVLRDVEQPGRELDLLARILSRVEREGFASPRMQALAGSLSGRSASRRIAGLARLIETDEWRKNVFFAPFAFLLGWQTQFAAAIDRWRARNGAEVPGWLRAVGEVEALVSFASYAHEHPGDPFPEILDAPAIAERRGGEPRFEAEEVTHPLIPASRAVRNSVSLGPDMRLLVVSGSNMSGKSTLLRTVGVNAILALAGAPVRARRFAISPLAIGASIRPVDSLQEGTSHFYAEITRLRTLVEIAGGPLPLLFLIDEILHGTNSHDRRIGSEAVVRGLLDRGAVGLITTHDLALARVADSLAPRAANVHFEDTILEGRIRFDYRLRPGVVTKSNALALMRAVGLEVPEVE
ncbi:MAG: DNA mismatch repair protein MutS [Candidatus Eisenbacteria bacterium]